MNGGSLLKSLARPIVRRLRGLASGRDVASPDYHVIRQSGLFDGSEYLRLYPDVAASGIDPLAHYVQHGTGEGRLPGGAFDAKYYLETYPDVAGAGVNPLLHYIVSGWREMRNPSSSFDTGWYWLMQMHCRADGTTPLSHYLRSAEPGASIAPARPLSAEDRREMLLAAQEAIGSGELGNEDYASLARYLEGNSIWDGAELAYRKILSADPAVMQHHLDVVRVLGIQGKHWQKVEVLSAARQWHEHDPALHFQLAEALESMDRYDEAATAFASAVALMPENAEWNYRLGFALERAGKTAPAKLAYEQACSRDTELGAKKFGIGVFHEKRAFWREAAEAYLAALVSRRADAELHFRHGAALDRCMEWELALEAFRNAVALGQDSAKPQWHYRIGYILERLERFEEAADAYAWAITQSDKVVSYWEYRRGYVLAQAGRYQEASEAYLRMAQEPVWDIASGLGGIGGSHAEQLVRRGVELLEAELGRDFQSAEKHFRLGLALRRLGEWERAAAAHANAVDRSEVHQPKYQYALGRSLVHLKKFEEACAAFAGYYILRRPHGVKADAYRKNPALVAAMEYCECMETLPVRQKVILYDSYNGGAPSCNPYAIFLHLLDDPEYSDWLHVWAVKDRSLIPRRYRRHTNVVFADRNSDLYRRYLATASHLISNTTLPPWFIRRPGQKYMNTWHGTPLKTLGRDMRGRFLEHKTFTRNLLHATHVISPNPHTTRIIAKRHEIEGIYPGMIAETGYPRVDLTLSPRDGRQNEIRKQLDIAPGAKVVLYAPTWRGTHGAIRFDVEQLRSDMGELAKLDIHVLFRGHALIEGIVSGLPGHTVVPNEIDTNELLGIVDVLVTDYSSIFFDFIPTGRPIIFYAYDLDEYERERGMYFDMRDMPGVLCRDMPCVVREVARIVESPETANERSAAAAAVFCPKEDGGATRRVVSFFMDDDIEHVVREPERTGPSVLMYAGDFLNNGITSSFLNLVGGMTEKGYRVTVGLDHANVAAQPIRMEKFSQVPESVQRITRIGGMVLSPEEKWVVDLFNKRYSLPSARAWDIYMGAYAREHRRIFGYAQFDSSVQFEGFLRFWASLLASEAPEVHKAIYLHSDMFAEYTVRFPHLRAIFELYSKYDTLVSVSKTIRDINAEKLSALCNVPERRFAYCMNAMDADQVVRKSLEPLDDDLARWMGGRYCFVTMGRLSPEKDHAKLVRAFASIRAQHPEAALVIAGDGPLAYDLAHLVDVLGLGGQVLMAGPRSNPFPLLRAAACFVLSSNHEGQPMVLLEAMVLGKPIVATDIHGSRDLLAGGRGLLVPNSLEGLAGGMAAAIAGQVRAADFDARAYQDEVMDRFAMLVVGSRDGKAADAALAHEIH
jgi:CDP-glycerol glycerophosphotransferase